MGKKGNYSCGKVVTADGGCVDPRSPQEPGLTAGLNFRIARIPPRVATLPEPNSFVLCWCEGDSC